MSSPISKIFRKALNVYRVTESTKISGVSVVYSDNTRLGWEEWEHILSKWLPRLDEYNWVESVNEIRIGPDYAGEPGAAAMYNHATQVVEIDDTESPFIPEYVDRQWEYVLLHELTHHAHTIKLKDEHNLSKFTLSKLQDRSGFNQKRSRLGETVGENATENALEAVADIGATTLLGVSHPTDIWDLYIELHGPTPKQLSR